MIPTSPGLYWRYGPNHDGELVEQVVKVDLLSVNSDDLFYWEHGRVGGIYIDTDQPGVEWEKVHPPVQFAHFWDCPHCHQKVPAYLEYCEHKSEPSSNTTMV